MAPQKHTWVWGLADRGISPVDSLHSPLVSGYFGAFGWINMETVSDVGLSKNDHLILIVVSAISG
jgi:hypothetical protein